ncbi:DUF433 domain-containing protein [Leptolyngbya sp. CCNP1308]|uniref:DUF433 domain-containing protein n=1 Tax=Leptolyngbya sp. CCNP1308 TaxID=3110255 RepID=UPI002B2064FA|nr:DUF433 domain-containing protein [Leptolyngbya sp. CCNP1308]MEA5448800.1 DUF433 domain-containing protein [Leptolyngbya sp. CCNP1308]
MTLQELQDQALQLSVEARWQLVNTVLASLQKETHCALMEPDPAFPDIAFRSDAENSWVPVVHGTTIHVRTVVIAATEWDWSTEQIAEEYGLSKAQVEAALVFYDTHGDEVAAAAPENAPEKAAEKTPEQAVESAKV